MPIKDPEARRAAIRRHYENNKADYLARARAHSAATRDAARQYAIQHLQQTPCMDCGEADIVVLEFDHRDRATKDFSIGDALRGKSFSLKRIIAEIAKCDVRYANCHRRKTAKEGGFFRHLFALASTEGSGLVAHSIRAIATTSGTSRSNEAEGAA